jgi:hypothetical protein
MTNTCVTNVKRKGYRCANDLSVWVDGLMGGPMGRRVGGRPDGWAAVNKTYTGRQMSGK